MANGTVTITAKVDAARAEEALKSLGAVATRVSTDMRKASTSQKAAADEATEAVRRQAEATQTLAQRTAEYTGRTIKMTGHMMAMGAAMGVAMGAVQGLGAAFVYARDQSALYESSMKSLQTITVRTGGNVADATALVKQFSDAISSPAAAAQAVRTFQTMNLSMEEQRRLITGIRDGLSSLGMDVNEQLPIMALAIKRQESVLLDNMGVTRTIEMMYKDYAKSIGSTVDRLTQQQKEQAVVNGVLKDLEPLAGQAKESLDTYKGSVSNLNAALLELGTTAGDKINPHLKFLNTQMAETARRLNGLVSDPVSQYIPADPKAKGDLGLPAGFKSVYSMPSGMQRLRTKQEQAEYNQQLADQARTSAEEAKKRAEQRAEEQKRQAQDLQDALLTIGKTGRDLELAQEAIYHRKQMEIARGNNRNLELEAERHRRALQAINAKHPGLVMGGVNTGAPGLSLSMSGGMGKLNMGSLGLGGWSASGGQTLSAANPGNPGAEWYANIKTATETGLFDAVKAAASADFGGLGSALQSVMAKAPDPMIQAMVGPAGLAFTFGQMIIDSFAQAEERVKQVQRHIKDLQPGPLSKDEQRKREVEDDSVRNRLIGEETGLRQQAFEARMRAQQGVLGAKAHAEHLEREADARRANIEQIDRAREASWKFADQQEEAAKAAEAFGKTLDKIAQDNKTILGGKTDAFNAYERFLVTSGKTTSQQIAQGKIGTALDGINSMITASGGKALTADDLAKLNPAMFDPSKDGKTFTLGASLGIDQTVIEKNGGAAAVESQILSALTQLFNLRTEAERLGPGSTPDRPSYASIVNFKDMYAFAPPGSLFHARGPGTGRAGGMRDRAVNTRAI